jgi:hypothetical protein
MSEIPCRVIELPELEVIPADKPANNGEALLVCGASRTSRRERVIPWEVGSSELDPVTTDRPRYGREIAFPALLGKSTSVIRRRPLKGTQGEGIVCASGNGGETRSSDLHEWRNDLGAVSSRDPVKL